jgi:hypothetical protein
MPTMGGWRNHRTRTEQRLMERAIAMVTKAMVDAGWKTYANKFNAVMKKRARRVYLDLLRAA